MKLILISTIIFVLAAAMGYVSCKKEYSCEGCATKSSKSPIAAAGPDQVSTLPTDSVLLDGRQSSNPDGTICRLSTISGINGAFPDEYHLINVIRRNGIRGAFT